MQLFPQNFANTSQFPKLLIVVSFKWTFNCRTLSLFDQKRHSRMSTIPDILITQDFYKNQVNQEKALSIEFL